MTGKAFFKQHIETEILQRLSHLQSNSAAKWGKMDAAQMLAHQNKVFQFAMDPKTARPPALLRGLLKLMIKSGVVGPKPYKKNGGTAPNFIVKEQVDFETEKKQFEEHLQLIFKKGLDGFEQHVHPIFGAMRSEEWGTLFGKHIDHHFKQFGI